MEVIDLDGKVFPYNFESFKRLSKNRVIAIIPKQIFPLPKLFQCFNDSTLIIKERVVEETEEGLLTVSMMEKSNKIKFSPLSDKEIRDILSGEVAYMWPHHHYKLELQNLN